MDANELQRIRKRVSHGDPHDFADMCENGDLLTIAKQYHTDLRALLTELDRVATAGRTVHLVVSGACDDGDHHLHAAFARESDADAFANTLDPVVLPRSTPIEWEPTRERFAPRVNAHVTISGVVRSAEQLRPVADAVAAALNAVCADAVVNFQLYASTAERINRKRQDDYDRR